MVSHALSKLSRSLSGYIDTCSTTQVSPGALYHPRTLSGGRGAHRTGKHAQRFDIPIQSCGEDHAQIRRCLVSGYFKNAARVQDDGTYRSIREGAVRRCSLLVARCSRGLKTKLFPKTLHVHPSSVMFTRTPTTGFVIFHEVVETSKSFMRDLSVIEQVFPLSPFLLLSGAFN
jgi:hypothetical protein